MAATITIVCPECSKQVQAAAEVAGKKLRCKACGNVFRATPAAPPGAVARSPGGQAEPVATPRPPADDDEDGDGTPYTMSAISDTPRCPECANEMESPDAIVCLHCGYNTVTRERPKVKKLHETTDGDRLMWLLPGILCAATVFFVLMVDLSFVTVPVSDDPGFVERFFFGKGVKIWGSVSAAFIIFFAGRFAYQRLFLHPIPPEIEK